MRYAMQNSLTITRITMLKVIVTGGSGQLATAIERASRTSAHDYRITPVEELDICDGDALRRALQDADIVINCAAYTDVERAEEERDLAIKINALSVKQMADICREKGVKLIHISTDYVFGGSSNRTMPYTEEDSTAPLNIYGESKAMGEVEALKNSDAVVVRTSWLYSPWGKNFCRTIVTLAATNETLRVVNDQRGVPTSALSLAEMLVTVIEKGTWRNMRGIYHYCDGGEASWYEFAKEIVRLSGITTCDVLPCTTAERPSNAARPQYSLMSTDRIRNECGIVIKPWQERLSEVINYKE